jgi:hypothetical protein
MAKMIVRGVEVEFPRLTPRKLQEIRDLGHGFAEKLGPNWRGFLTLIDVRTALLTVYSEAKTHEILYAMDKANVDHATQLIAMQMVIATRMFRDGTLGIDEPTPEATLH